MNKNIFTAIAVSCLMIVGAIGVSAQSPESSVDASMVKYPIAALGGCKDKVDCKDFCTKAENMLACVTFAEQQGMLKGEPLRVSKIVAEKVSKKETPGGCTTKDECENYCQGNVERINECVNFGEQLGVIPAEELAEAKKIAAALSKGANLPGGCKTKKECQNYCSNGDRIDECLNFAEAAGILPEKELAEARKVAPFLKNGQTPGACKTKEECNAYCEKEGNVTECIGFAEKVGFISKEEAEIAKKVGGKGPGGCKGKDECLNYCNSDEHAEECLNFAQEKGLLSEEEKEMVNTGIDRMKQGLEQVPSEVREEVISCLENKVGKEKFQKVLNKEAVLTQNQGQQIQECFANISGMMQEKMMKQGGGPEGAIPPGVSGMGGGTPPSREDIMKNIPDNVPSEMREQIEQQIEAQMPKDIPTGAGAPPSGTMPPAGSGAPNVDCAMFKTAPSCEYIPAGTPRDMCIKCKGG